MLVESVNARGVRFGGCGHETLLLERGFTVWLLRRLLCPAAASECAEVPGASALQPLAVHHAGRRAAHEHRANAVPLERQITAGQRIDDPVAGESAQTRSRRHCRRARARGEGDARAAARNALENLKAIVEAGGSSLDHVLNVTLYIKSLDDFGVVNEVYSQYFASDPKPARTLVPVAGARGLVSFDAIAYVPD